MEVESLKFRENGLIPAIAQDAATGEVLMMAYMNRDALQKTLETGKAWYWSRDRQALWMKGETSGHFQQVQDIQADCDGDTLLLTVEQHGAGACHEGYRSCFHYPLQVEWAEPDQDGEGAVASVAKVSRGEAGIEGFTFSPAEVYGDRAEDAVQELYRVVMERKDHPREGSYTTYLFDEGIDKILKKIGEESAEVVIASKNASTQPFLDEVADLLYHLVVLLAERGVAPHQVFEVLKERRREK